MKIKTTIDYIRERLPKHMVPAFNKIVADNKDAKDFGIFLQAYKETIDEVDLAPIQAWEAFIERNSDLEEAKVIPEPDINDIKPTEDSDVEMVIEHGKEVIDNIVNGLQEDDEMMLNIIHDIADSGPEGETEAE